MSESFPQQHLKRRVAADDAIHRHDGRGRNRGGDVNEVPVPEFDVSCSVAAGRLLSRRSEVGGRCVNRQRARDPALQQIEAQSSDSRANVQQDAVNRAHVHEHVTQ